MHGCMIQIIEDVVGMYFSMPFHVVLISNWMTREELVVRLIIFLSLSVALVVVVFSFLSYSSFWRTRLPNGFGTSLSFPRGFTWSRRPQDGGEIRIYNFGNPSSLKWPTHVATLHLPPPQDHRVLLELITTTGPFLACLPAGVPFISARNVRAHVFTLHHDRAVHRGR